MLENINRRLKRWGCDCFIIWLCFLFFLPLQGSHQYLPIYIPYYRVPANFKFVGRAEAAVAQWRMRHSLRPTCRTRALRHLISLSFYAKCGLLVLSNLSQTALFTVSEFFGRFFFT